MVKKNLAIIFGAKSPEHEVSIVSFSQALDWVDKQKYNPIIIYLDQSQNQPYLCSWPKKKDISAFIKKVLKNNKKIDFVNKGILVNKFIGQKKINIDVALLIMHGSYGEDGRLQGLLDFYDIPYTGSGVLGSITGMDKVATKQILISAGMSVAPYIWFFYEEFKNDSKNIVKTIKKELKYPIFVKPARAGSSVGISKVEKEKDLKRAVKKASQFDFKIVVEQGIQNAVDINCAVMGGIKPIASVCEQPISEDKFLSFREKYLKGGKTKGMAGLSRVVPAPISDKISKKIQMISKLIFRELGCWGMGRIDFLYQEKGNKIYANEINTIPGSLSYYLWEASGINPRELINRMIDLGLKRNKFINNLKYNFKTKILEYV